MDYDFVSNLPQDKKSLSAKALEFIRRNRAHEKMLDEKEKQVRWIVRCKSNNNGMIRKDLPLLNESKLKKKGYLAKTFIRKNAPVSKLIMGFEDYYKEYDSYYYITPEKNIKIAILKMRIKQLERRIKRIINGLVRKRDLIQFTINDIKRIQIKGWDKI